MHDSLLTVGWIVYTPNKGRTSQGKAPTLGGCPLPSLPTLASTSKVWDVYFPFTTPALPVAPGTAEWPSLPPQHQHRYIYMYIYAHIFGLSRREVPLLRSGWEKHLQPPTPSATSGPYANPPSVTNQLKPLHPQNKGGGRVGLLRILRRDYGGFSSFFFLLFSSVPEKALIFSLHF